MPEGRLLTFGRLCDGRANKPPRTIFPKFSIPLFARERRLPKDRAVTLKREH
jgi:hypothetical protein